MTYKVVLVGPSNSGKTAFLYRHLTGQFLTEHRSNIGFEVHPLRFTTKYGLVTFDVWDCTGANLGFSQGYWQMADAAIVVVDRNDQNMLREIQSYVQRLQHECPNIPIVVCAGKCDLKSNLDVGAISAYLAGIPEDEKYRNFCQHTPKQVNYFDISARSNYNFEKPFLALARHFYRDRNLVFMEKTS